jgi:hypothetical protein
MTRDRRDIEVGISKRILWVDGNGYPIMQIDRIAFQPHPLKWGRILRAYAKEMSRWIGFGVLTLLVDSCLGDALHRWVYIVAIAIAAGGAIWHTRHLVRLIALPPLHKLVVTLGTQRAFLLTTDRAKLADARDQIVRAIENPDVEYKIHIDSFENIYGDKIEGDKVLGDSVGGDKNVTHEGS